MKLILAFWRPHKVSDVTLALYEHHALRGASLSEAQGFGRRGEVAPGHRTSMDLERRTRLEVVCADDLVEEITATIERAAHTGRAGDGKIYVLDVAEAVRISTGEHGEAAI